MTSIDRQKLIAGAIAGVLTTAVVALVATTRSKAPAVKATPSPPPAEAPGTNASPIVAVAGDLVEVNLAAAGINPANLPSIYRAFPSAAMAVTSTDGVTFTGELRGPATDRPLPPMPIPPVGPLTVPRASVIRVIGKAPSILPVEASDIVRVDPKALPMITPPPDALEVLSYDVQVRSVTPGTLDGVVLAVNYTVPTNQPAPGEVPAPPMPPWREVIGTYDAPPTVENLPRAAVRQVVRHRVN